jgi:cysteinyl-tRNA synthetase
MPIHLTDTATRSKRSFQPGDPSRVTLYVCGPTVYDRAHIGNFRPAVVFDTLFRLLRQTYGAEHVLYARNITDIDDKIIAKAVAGGEAMAAITARFEAIYQDDLRGLNVLPPSFEPHATAHVGDMIAMMQTLEAAGHAYAAPSGLFFSVASMADYGKLAQRPREEQLAAARTEAAPDKRDPADFALWKAAKPGEPEDALYDSPWGRGRPGWHIECSAMSAATLGETIDIHGGGLDLIFPHHENEIAQSECAHGKPFVRYWLHNGFLDFSGQKMSKSEGNVVLVNDLLKQWPGEVIRHALLSAHYRAPLDWTPDLLAQSRTTLNRLYGALRRVWDAVGAKPRTDALGVLAALHDDLNTPEAFAALSALAGEANSAADRGDRDGMAQARADLLASGALLGLLEQSPQDWEQGGDAELRARVEALIAQRLSARKAKDWAQADRIRDELGALGVEIMDGPTGTTWRKV